MPKITPFSANQFTATKFDTAEEKAKRANQLANFVKDKMPMKSFTNNGVYHTLYQHMFGHIAHTNMLGFWGEWFEFASTRWEWICKAAGIENYGPSGQYDSSIYGDPEYTYSDVEKAFRAWLRSQTDLIESYRVDAANEAQAQAYDAVQRNLRILSPDQRKDMVTMFAR